jgi:hypothetical protein
MLTLCLSAAHLLPAGTLCPATCPSTGKIPEQLRPMTLHAFNQRILAEDLVRVRRADDLERYAASQRHARIDPNPHQIDAVIFALRRLREGGCILADEVGLGKTIEAGLAISPSNVPVGSTYCTRPHNSARRWTAQEVWTRWSLRGNIGRGPDGSPRPRFLAFIVRAAADRNTDAEFPKISCASSITTRSNGGAAPSAEAPRSLPPNSRPTRYTPGATKLLWSS